VVALFTVMGAAVVPTIDTTCATAACVDEDIDLSVFF
jgi:hypothetical protein